MNSGFRARWFWLALAVLVTDQVSKYAVENSMGDGQIQVMLPGLVNLVHTHNRGVAFGILADAQSGWVTWLLVLFSLVVMVLLIWLLSGEHVPGHGGQAGVALILGGAAGNVMDRMLRHSVVDFLDFHYRSYHWPAFNVADSAIVIGAALVILSLLAERRKPAQRRA